ncbi:MAG: hypothetical protein AB1599_02820 [Planctomycetota bacterium]
MLDALSIWLKHGLTTIEIPEDQKYLSEIVPILEEAEKNVYDVADERLSGYREETQRKIIGGVFLNLREDPVEYQATTKSKGKK